VARQNWISPIAHDQRAVAPLLSDPSSLNAVVMVMDAYASPADTLFLWCKDKLWRSPACHPFPKHVQ
jgi:hypothetical protein